MCCVLVIPAVTTNLWVVKLCIKPERTVVTFIQDTGYKPSIYIEIILYSVYHIECILSTAYQKEEEKIKSHVTMVVRYTWNKFESSSFVQAQISIYMCASTGMMHKINGLILDRVSFDTLDLICFPTISRIILNPSV